MTNFAAVLLGLGAIGLLTCCCYWHKHSASQRRMRSMAHAGDMDNDIHDILLNQLGAPTMRRHSV